MMRTGQSRISTSLLMVIALVLLLVVYPLSIGPVGWACARWEERYGDLPEVVTIPLQLVYLPLVLVANAAPPWFSSAMRGYTNWWMEK